MSLEQQQKQCQIISHLLPKNVNTILSKDRFCTMGKCWDTLNTFVCTPGLCELPSVESFSGALSPEGKQITDGNKHYY